MGRKRLHRVEAINNNGAVIYRRDYQSRKAAERRKDRLLEGVDLPPATNHPDDEGYYREPATSVVIWTSDVVTWPSDPLDCQVYINRQVTS